MQVNRRSFIGGMVAAAAANPRLAGAQTGAPVAPSAAQGKWMKRGLVDAGGDHEPYIFMVRRGGYRLDAKQQCDYQQSEELIRELHREGVEVFHTHLYKGFGMEAEREDMEAAKKAVAFAHSLGMRADVYVQWNTLMYETFFAEQPDGPQWIQRDALGQPIMLPYGYEQSFRYRPCFSNQNYLDYLKKVVRYAVVDVKADFIHFDNFGLNAEPESCHCTHCMAGFRHRLKTKYTPAQLRERFGFSRIDFVGPPLWNMDNPPSKMQVVSDPAFQEWIDYRCQMMSDALKQMHDLVHSLNQEVALEINSGGITGHNLPWAAGVDHARLLPYTRSFWSEEGNQPELHADGRLVTRVRSFKLARAYSNVLITYIEDDPLAFSESLVFNQTAGYLGMGPLSPVTKTYLDFYLRNRDSYEGAESAANIAVLRSYASLSYNNARVQLCTMLAEQTLIEQSIPFDLIFDENLHDLQRYKVVVLPDTECFSDGQIGLLKAFVAGGGSVVLIGNVAGYDEWRRVRPVPGFADLVKYETTATSAEGGGEEDTKADARRRLLPQRKQVGPGKVGYLPALPFAGPWPPARPYFAVLNEFWKLPANAEELVSLLNWAANDAVPLALSSAPGVVGEVTVQPDKQRTHVHVLNYNAARVPVQRDIKVRVLLPANARATRCTMRSPEAAGEMDLPVRAEGSWATVTVPELRYYAMLTISS